MSPLSFLSPVPQLGILGYWGYGSQHKLTALLTSLSTTSLPSTQQFSQKENQLVWNVVRIGINRNSPPQHNTIAAISASGLSTTPDAWVNVAENQRLILAREAFGRVPLYWTQQKEVIWFASRLQLLLPILQQRDVSIPGLYGYSCFSYVPSPLTPVNGVFAVPAGTELIWQGNCELGKLSQPQSRNLHSWREQAEQIKDEATAVTQLQTLLKASIQRQIADLKAEPVGVFLSGGLDSAIVAALLVQAGVKVRAYTLDFGGGGISEFPYAEQVAQFLQIPLVKVAASPREIKNALISTVQALDLPFGDGVTVPFYLLAQKASQETRVIFNGEGGDQLFAGWTNKPLIAAGIYQAGENFILQYLRTFHRLWSYESQVYQSDVYAQIQNLHPQDWIVEALDATCCPSLLHRLRRASLMLKGAQNIHPRATALGFAHGLWVRSPFCDLSLAEWTFHLSGELCLQGACEKYILKRAVENWLPPEIIWRQKRGMGVPLTSWCLNEFWHDLGIWLNPGRLSAENRFSSQIAAQIVTGELGGAIQGRRIGESLWLLIMWELWRSHILGEELGKHSWNHPFWLPSWLWRRYKQWQA